MREIEIIVNEFTEIVSVDYFFSFSIKYHNLSSTADTISERERLIVNWSTTGVWLKGENELLIKGERSWRDVSKDLLFFLDWQNPDSTHSPISLKMLFYAIIDSLKHDRWKSFDTYQGHSIRISEIAQHYSEKALQEEKSYIQNELTKVIHENLKKDGINLIKKKQYFKSADVIKKEREKEALASISVLDNFRANGTPDKKKEEALDKREKDKKAPFVKAKNIYQEPLSTRCLLAKKNWIELPDKVKSMILLKYEMAEDDMKRYWDGVDYSQREECILSQIVL